MKRTIKRCRGFRAFLTFLLLVIVNGVAWSATRFCLTYSRELQAVPISGRALLMLSADPAVDPDIPSPFRPFITFGMDFANWKPEETLLMTGQNSESYMATIGQLKGKYSLRAVIDTDLQSSILQKQGTLYSDKIIIEINENGENVVELKINNIVKGGEFKETETVKLLKVKSNLLSAFFQEPTFIEAAVILPAGYEQDPGKLYPVVFVFPGWGSTHMAVTRDDFQQKRYGMSGYGREKIFVFLNQDCRFGFHVFADSENNGPRATSFVKEFIPFLEATYRVERNANGRFLVGQSSGGWAALWLQINFPDVFGMAWAGSPDPVDFRDFVGHDLYDTKTNLFYDAQGRLTNAMRDSEHPFTNKEWLEMEAVLGDGGQYQSFEAVFGARGRDGKPQQFFDRKTGEIDRLALEHWKAYDINLLLQKNAETLREKLAGRIHIVVAANDPFFLDGSVRLLKDTLARLMFKSDIEILEGGEHNTWSEESRKKMHEKMDGIFLQAPPSGDRSACSGPYLGQKPPGMTAEIFAPGIISTSNPEVCISFTPDGREVFYTVGGPPHSVILFRKEIDGIWTEAQVAPFSGSYSAECQLSPDGKQLYFCSGMPFSGTGDPKSNWDLFKVERNGAEWGESIRLDAPLRSDAYSADCPTIAGNGNIYFYSVEYPGGLGKGDIYISRFENDQYGEPENLGSAINNEHFDMDPFIAPDESYLIFSSSRPGGSGNNDLYISFRKPDGGWSAAVNMGSAVNSYAHEIHPFVSRDGKYLFFCSKRRIAYKRHSDPPLSFPDKINWLAKPGNELEDIYWVDAGIIKKLKASAMN